MTPLVEPNHSVSMIRYTHCAGGEPHQHVAVRMFLSPQPEERLTRLVHDIYSFTDHVAYVWLIGAYASPTHSLVLIRFAPGGTIGIATELVLKIALHMGSTTSIHVQKDPDVLLEEVLRGFGITGGHRPPYLVEFDGRYWSPPLIGF